MKTEIRLVTPAWANNILKNHNTKNRNMRQKKVDEYSRDMKSGHWEKNGESIKISEDGTLKDGQHRLAAVVKSGCSVEMVVVTGVPNECNIYDTHAVRSATDILVFMGHEKVEANKSVVATVRFILNEYIGAKGYISTVSEISEYICDNKNELTCVAKMMSKHGRLQTNIKKAPACAAVFFALKSGYDLETAKRFCDVAKSGMSEGETEYAAIIYRNQINAGTLGADTYADRIQLMHATEKALEDFEKGYKRKAAYGKEKNGKFSSAYKENYKRMDVE